MDRKKWEYENILKEQKLENRFDNFLRYLLAMLKRKYANSVGSFISPNIKLAGASECALVYNPQYRSKHPKLILYIPSLYETGCDDSPHSARSRRSGLLQNKGPWLSEQHQRGSPPLYGGATAPDEERLRCLQMPRCFVAIYLSPFFLYPASQWRPLSVRRYFCRRLLGLSGIVISINPSARALLRWAIFNCLIGDGDAHPARSSCSNILTLTHRQKLSIPTLPRTAY